ncbi:MAG: D-alanine--D-alanine ligase [Oligoflexia bacterium]|nr:D-alanine--D-alanine ligase [Oligoflexia bacterium]
MNKKNVVVLYGGRSTEHEVSLKSAAFVLKNLSSEKYNIYAIGINHSGEWVPQNTSRILKKIEGEEEINSLTIEYADSDKDTCMEEKFARSLLPRIRTAERTTERTIERTTTRISDNETVVFPILHGTYGEDGQLQGLLEMSAVPYVGADNLSSAICMDKVVAKELVRSIGIPIVPYITFRQHEWSRNHLEIIEKIEKEFKFPLFIKPVSLGSSVGISIVRDVSALKTAIGHAFLFDEKVIVEKSMNAREIQFAALGTYDADISDAGEINYGGCFYSYGVKYQNENFSQSNIPVNLPRTKIEEGKDLCKKIFKVLQIHGLARIDFFLSKDDGKYYFNETNTIPGLTNVSQYAQLWKYHGVEPSLLMDRLIESAISRHELRKKLKRTYNYN